MPTQLYLTTATAPYTPPTLRGAWDQTAGAVTRALDTPKARDGAITTVFQDESNAAADYDCLLYRGVSGKLAAQTVDGTLDVVLGVLEINAANDLVFHVHVYVTQGDTDTPRGTLLSDYIDATEWPTGSGTGQAFAAAQALSSLAVSAGDRIVVEIGSRSLAASATFARAILWYGTQQVAHSDPSPDLTAGSTNVAAEAGFLLFSDDLVWEEEGRLTHSHMEVMEDADADPAEGWLTHVHLEAMEDADADPAEGWLTHTFIEVMFDALPPAPPASPTGLGITGGRRRAGRRVIAPVSPYNLPGIAAPPVDPSWMQQVRLPSGWPRRILVVHEGMTLAFLPVEPGVFGRGPGWQYTIFQDRFLYSDGMGHTWEFSPDQVTFEW